MQSTGKDTNISKIAAILPLVIGVSALLASFHASGQDEQLYDVYIKPKRLVEAINELSLLTGMHIASSEETLPDALQSPFVKGRMSRTTALARLLAGTDIGVVWVKEDWGMLMRQAPDPKTEKSRNRSAGSTGKVQLTLEELEGVTVTGSRLRLLLQDAASETFASEAAPVYVIDRPRIKNSGVSDLSDLLKLIVARSFIRSEASQRIPQVELRGLGADSTLILINGRRTVASSASVASNTFDISSIPLAAVEKVEVLTGAASAVYGTDAIGGVINVLLKKYIPDPIAEIQFGGVSDGGTKRRATFSAGYGGERLRASVVLDVLDRSFLFGADRDRWANSDLRRYGGMDYRTTLANPGNVNSLSSSNLPGLNAQFAAVPSGVVGRLEISDFYATAGRENLESSYRFLSIMPERKRWASSLFADLKISDSVSGYVEYLYSDNSVATQSEPTSASLRVPASNPFNPFGVAVDVGYQFRDIGPTQTITDSNLRRGVVGLRGVVNSWDWEASIFASSERTGRWSKSVADIGRINSVLAETASERTLNVFSDGPAASQQVLRSILAPRVVDRSESHGVQASLVARGDVLQLPAGKLGVVVGSEVLSEKALVSGVLPIDNGRSVTSGFAEVRLPLANDSMKIPFLREFSLKAAARYDSYSDFGHAYTPQFDLNWTMCEALMVRASYGNSFRAPSLFELYAPQIRQDSIPVPDYLRNSEITSISVLAGGNPNLNPVTAKAFSAGFVVAQQALGLRLSSDYWRIRMDNRVQPAPYLTVVTHPDLFPGRVIREDATATDIAAGMPGRLSYVDLTRDNFGRVDTSGVDVAIAYEFDSDIGTFTPQLTGSWVLSYDAYDLPGESAVDRVGVATAIGTIPRLRAVANLEWSRRNLGFTATARYTSSYDDATLLQQRTGRSIPEQVLVDAQLSIEIDNSNYLRIPPGSEITIRIGAQNLFDTLAPFSASGGPLGYDSTQGDLEGRYLYGSASIKF